MGRKDVVVLGVDAIPSAIVAGTKIQEFDIKWWKKLQIDERLQELRHGPSRLEKLAGGFFGLAGALAVIAFLGLWAMERMTAQAPEVEPLLGLARLATELFTF